MLVDEGPGRVHELIALGAEFDREADGLARPGPRGRPLDGPRGARRRGRHRGRGRTGPGRRHLPVRQRRARGLVRPRPARRGRPLRRGDRAAAPGAGAVPAGQVRADHVVLATGGAGQLFAVTTNPTEATGDGRGHGAAGRRARWPTSSSSSSTRPRCTTRPCPGRCCPRRCAATGRCCATRDGERFVDELAPRDVVSRAMAARMAEQGVDHLWLDATGLERFAERFPTIAASLGGHRARPRARLAAHRPGRPPPLRRRRHRPLGRHRAARACGRWARWPAPACTGPTAWPPTRCSRAWSSAPAWPSASPPAGRGPEPSGALRGVLGDAAARRHRLHAAARTRPARRPDRRLRPDRRPGRRGRCPRRDRRHQAPRHAAAGHDRGAGVVRTPSLAGRRPAPPGRRRSPAPGSAGGVGGRRRAGQPAPGGRRAVGFGRRRAPRAGAPTPGPSSPRPIRRAWRRRLVHRGAVETAPVDGDAVVWRRLVRRRLYARPRSTRWRRALAEDLGPDGDLTAALVPRDRHGALRAPGPPGRRAGRSAPAPTRRSASVDPALAVTWHADDGDALEARRHRARGDRPAAARSSPPSAPRSTSSATSRASPPSPRSSSTAAHAATRRCEVLDTRKTTPGLRALEKAAVRAGGGTNHRGGLSDAVLVKDNHLAGTSITDAVAHGPGAVARPDGRDRVRHARPGGRGGPGRRRRRAARQHGPGRAWPRPSRWPTATRRGPILIEVSGGVTLDTVGAYAAAGPDRISVGALTHSATVLDLGLDLVWTTDDGRTTARRRRRREG